MWHISSAFPPRFARKFLGGLPRILMHPSAHSVSHAVNDKCVCAVSPAHCHASACVPCATRSLQLVLRLAWRLHSIHGDQGRAHHRATVRIALEEPHTRHAARTAQTRIISSSQHAVAQPQLHWQSHATHLPSLRPTGSSYCKNAHTPALNSGMGPAALAHSSRLGGGHKGQGTRDKGGTAAAGTHQRSAQRQRDLTWSGNACMNCVDVGQQGQCAHHGASTTGRTRPQQAALLLPPRLPPVTPMQQH